ncbi:DUF4255 domain-containing protein [Paraburkholderia sp. 35.1]|uniref:DUF4255 domain-containing protein n=1 Tax=Paraburkholderia sp. 35.1 TaxID=2991058 RepID=UPI003D1CB581
MSTALAIAATTRVIAAVVDDAVAAARLLLPTVLGSATTSSSPPDHLVTVIDGEVTHLNLFLYHVTYNQGWREVGLPTRSSSGSQIGRAPLAIDLHYLMSAYSAGDYEAQIMLGVGMQAVHEIPVLFRDKIAKVFQSPATALDQALASADLANQIEMIKIVPQQIGTDELSKLWTAFQSKFRVSAAYAVSVVLIETQTPVVAALPVLSRNIVVLPFVDPVIDAIAPQIIPYAPDASITLTGSNLVAQNTVVVFGGNPAAPQTPTVKGTGATISAPLPVLTAGLNTVSVVRQVDFGTPPKTSFAESNAASFILQPRIRRDAAPPNDYLIKVGAPTTPMSPPLVPITVTLDPAFTATQKISLLLNPLNPPAGATARSYLFDATADGFAPPNEVTVDTQGVPAGDYLVRIRVDGADSPLDLDAGTHAFSTPKVTL